jgi:hypothetical protein
MIKRCLLTLLLLLFSTPAWAGSYLDRAALLVAEAHRANVALREHSLDRELGSVVQRIAEARLVAAKTMLVPKEVVLAHPHLLLILENHERAAAAAADGQTAKVVLLTLKADEEERVLRRVLEQLGWPLPKVGA